MAMYGRRVFGLLLEKQTLLSRCIDQCVRGCNNAKQVEWSGVVNVNGFAKLPTWKAHCDTTMRYDAMRNCWIISEGWRNFGVKEDLKLCAIDDKEKLVHTPTLVLYY